MGKYIKIFKQAMALVETIDGVEKVVAHLKKTILNLNDKIPPSQELKEQIVQDAISIFILMSQDKEKRYNERDEKILTAAKRIGDFFKQEYIAKIAWERNVKEIKMYALELFY